MSEVPAEWVDARGDTRSPSACEISSEQTTSADLTLLPLGGHRLLLSDTESDFSGYGDAREFSPVASSEASCGPHPPVDPASSYIFALPTEIVGEIFTLLASIDAFRTLRSPWTEDDNSAHLGWVIVTHVCQRWRAIAMGQPALWSTIPAPPVTPWTHAFLERVQDAPIALMLEDRFMRPSESEAAFVDIMGVVTHRLRVASLSGAAALLLAHSIFSRVDTNTHGVRSSLKSLDIRVAYSPSFVFPTAFFTTLQPPLQRFSIMGCRPRWADMDFGGLTELHVEMRPTVQMDSEPTERSHSLAMLDALQRMPELESLTLINCFFGGHPSPVVRLHVRKLVLGGLGDNCAALLEHLDIPASTKLSVSCVDRPRHPQQALLTALAARFGPAHAPAIRTLHITSSLLYVVIRGWTAQHLEHSEAHDTLDTPDVYILLFAHNTAYKTKALKAICDVLHLTALETLYSDFLCDHRDHWGVVHGGFKHCGALRLVKLEADASFLNAPTTPSSIEALACLFPQVRTLVLFIRERRYCEEVDGEHVQKLRVTWRASECRELYIYYQGMRDMSLPAIKDELPGMFSDATNNHG
ncbi:hypothetical protein FA95DRAFT_798403 [Auriscalpium vulgare]|uniref:Uncharacterized protein n=1 Tax=Auriscalpium vulgare TaxID=40419 RepID=A0ACB8S029_9AGAM|nr:hypothetical protein FA95DRAFT_798403 [Auriscalpium vulgare]